jgi:hypothetical protein
MGTETDKVTAQEPFTKATANAVQEPMDRIQQEKMKQRLTLKRKEIISCKRWKTISILLTHHLRSFHAFQTDHHHHPPQPALVLHLYLQLVLSSKDTTAT